VSRDSDGWRLTTPTGVVRSGQVLFATNGYSAEDMPDWLGGRYVPTQSTVLVTRPLDPDELAAQGWTSDQMAYDSRNLVHYFRLMPDRRFLFGSRGGLRSSPQAEARARARNRRDFEAMFPAWRHVASDHSWSGLVCLSAKKMPYVGPVPDQPGAFCAMAYHGNGVSMGSHCGKLAAALIAGDARPEDLPIPLRAALPRFPLGRSRRMLMPPVYLGLAPPDRACRKGCDPNSAVLLPSLAAR